MVVGSHLALKPLQPDSPIKKAPPAIAPDSTFDVIGSWLMDVGFLSPEFILYFPRVKECPLIPITAYRAFWPHKGDTPTKGGDNTMKKTRRLLPVLVVLVTFLLIPLLSDAVPGNGSGTGNAGGNGNHFGWDKDHNNRDDQPVSVPEPLTLTLLALGIGGIGSYFAIRKRRK